MAKPKSEAVVTKEIRDYLTQNGWYVWKNHGGPMSQAGLPDLMAVKGGRFIAIEVKTISGKLTPLQQKTLHRFREKSAWVFVARSVRDVESTLEFFSRQTQH